MRRRAMNSAKDSREATQKAQKENSGASLKKLLDIAERAIRMAVQAGKYETTIFINGSIQDLTKTEVRLGVESLRKFGYMAKISSTNAYIDISW